MKPAPENLEELQAQGWQAWGRIFAEAILAGFEEEKEGGLKNGLQICIARTN